MGRTGHGFADGARDTQHGMVFISVSGLHSKE